MNLAEFAESGFVGRGQLQQRRRQLGHLRPLASAVTWSSSLYSLVFVWNLGLLVFSLVSWVCSSVIWRCCSGSVVQLALGWRPLISIFVWIGRLVLSVSWCSSSPRRVIYRRKAWLQRAEPSFHNQPTSCMICNVAWFCVAATSMNCSTCTISICHPSGGLTIYFSSVYLFSLFVPYLQICAWSSSLLGPQEFWWIWSWTGTCWMMIIHDNEFAMSSLKVLSIVVWWSPLSIFLYNFDSALASWSSSCIELEYMYSIPEDDWPRLIFDSFFYVSEVSPWILNFLYSPPVSQWIQCLCCFVWYWAFIHFYLRLQMTLSSAIESTPGTMNLVWMSFIFSAWLVAYSISHQILTGTWADYPNLKGSATSWRCSSSSGSTSAWKLGHLSGYSSTFCELGLDLCLVMHVAEPPGSLIVLFHLVWYIQNGHTSGRFVPGSSWYRPQPDWKHLPESSCFWCFSSILISRLELYCLWRSYSWNSISSSHLVIMQNPLDPWSPSSIFRSHHFCQDSYRQDAWSASFDQRHLQSWSPQQMPWLHCCDLHRYFESRCHFETETGPWWHSDSPSTTAFMPQMASDSPTTADIHLEYWEQRGGSRSQGIGLWPSSTWCSQGCQTSFASPANQVICLRSVSSCPVSLSSQRNCTTRGSYSWVDHLRILGAASSLMSLTQWLPSSSASFSFWMCNLRQENSISIHSSGGNRWTCCSVRLFPI